jgi:hypothetical protein
MSDDKPNRDEQLEQRKRELEEELETYAQAGVSSPGLLKVARWVSRGLYFAMAGLVVFLLFSGWGKISQHDFESVQQALEQQTKKLSEVRTERDEYARQFMQTESQLRRERAARELADSPHTKADTALAAAAVMLTEEGLATRWAREWREEARPRTELLAELQRAYRDAHERDRLELLALLAHADGDELAGLMTSVATATERPAAERIIAVRWLAGRKEDRDAMGVLNALAQGEGPVAREAAQHVSD